MIVIYPQHNNKLAVIIPCTGLAAALRDVPANVQYKIVDKLDIINEFFDAYEYIHGSGAVLNIEKAKDLKRNQFRQARKPMLEQLDVQYMRAVESSNTALKKSIAAKKQQLRDVTSIDLPDDADELVNFWPDVLKGA